MSLLQIVFFVTVQLLLLCFFCVLGWLQDWSTWPGPDSERLYFNFSCLFLFKIHMGLTACVQGPKRRGGGVFPCSADFLGLLRRVGRHWRAIAPSPTPPFSYTGFIRQCCHKKEYKGDASLNLTLQAQVVYTPLLALVIGISWSLIAWCGPSVSGTTFSYDPAGFPHVFSLGRGLVYSEPMSTDKTCVDFHQPHCHAFGCFLNPFCHL